MLGRLVLVLIVLAGFLLGTACNEAGDQGNPLATSSVRLIRTERVQKATETPQGLQATIMWPATRELDMYEAGALGDPFLDLDPDWGSLTGAAQVGTESGGSKTLDNSVEIQLKSLASIEPLRSFCERHYPNSVVLIHCEADNAWLTSAEQLIRDYGGSDGG